MARVFRYPSLYSVIDYLLLLTEVLLLLCLEMIESPRLTTPLWVMLNARSR